MRPPDFADELQSFYFVPFKGDDAAQRSDYEQLLLVGCGLKGELRDISRSCTFFAVVRLVAMLSSSETSSSLSTRPPSPSESCSLSTLPLKFPDSSIASSSAV